MKITNLFLLFVAILTVTSCGKNDENISDGVTRTWELTMLEYSGTSFSYVSGNIYPADFMGTGRDMMIEVDFNTDGTYDSRGTYTVDVTYDLGSELFSRPSIIRGFIGGDGTYSTEGDQMTINPRGGDPIVATIIEMEEDNMEIYFRTEDRVTQQDGLSLISMYGQYTFKRK